MITREQCLSTSSCRMWALLLIPRFKTGLFSLMISINNANHSHSVKQGAEALLPCYAGATSQGSVLCSLKALSPLESKPKCLESASSRIVASGSWDTWNPTPNPTACRSHLAIEQLIGGCAAVKHNCMTILPCIELCMDVLNPHFSTCQICSIFFKLLFGE